MDVAPRALPVLPIGREVEATRLAQLIDDTVAGAKRAVILLGAPGIGKTTLLRWARNRAERRGCITASVRVPAAAGLPPRYPLGQLLEGFASACIQRGFPVPDRLGRVVATLTGNGSIDTYAVDVPQIADALEEVGRAGPLAVFIDDYHWTPPEGVELLIAALRVLETQVCLVASARLHGLGEEAAASLPEPSADLWVEHLEVRGLEASAVASLAEAILGAEVLPSLVDALYSRTFGNPLFIVETLQGWRTGGALVLTGGFWGIDQDAAPAQPRSLREMITARLARIDSDALAVARSLAAIGRDADFDELSAVGDVGGSRLVQVVDQLIDDGLVALDTHPSPRYRLAHPLYGTALLDEEGTSGRSLLHGRIFAELRRRGDAGRTTSAAELAHHAVRALTPPPDLRVVLTAAAEEAEAAGSYEEAAVWYGYLAEVADDPRELARALRGQATAAIKTDPQRAIGIFTYALELESDAESRARLLLGRARAYRGVGTPELAFADLDQALPLAAQDEVFDIRHAIGAFNGMLRRLDEAERIFRSLALESIDTSHHSKAVGHLGMVALIRGSIAEGTLLMESALATCTDDEYANYLRGNLAWLFGLLGRWEEAEAMVEQTLAIAVASGDIETECSMSGIGGRLAAWRGDLAKAFDRATRGHRLALRLGNSADVITTSDALAVALMENDMHDEAAGMLAHILAIDGPETEEREMSYSFTVFARACLLAGDPTRARTALDRARTHLPGAPFWAVAIDRCEAQIDLACSDPDRALGRLRPWLERPTEIVLEHAHVCDVTAQAQFALGDRDGAEARAREALASYQRLGASRMAERMSAWIDAMRTPRKGRPRSSLPGRLTARESEILRLVVLGRSNQGVADELVISVATVKKHLENIMAKAGVSRRTELVPFAISVGVLVAEELVLEREAVRERAAGSLVPRPARTHPPVAPRSTRPARGKQADPRPLERPGK
jgi:DNA-binding CsgD family transcriptional regulator